MRLLFQFFSAVLFLTVTVVGWAACPEGTRNNYKGECVEVLGKHVIEREWRGGVYAGDLVNGIPNGLGHFTFSNGTQYVGQFKDGEFLGQGTLVTDNGVKYVGEWKDSKRNGHGTLTWPNGDKFVGNWKNGKRHGQGTYIWASGKKQKGEWKDGTSKTPLDKSTDSDAPEQEQKSANKENLTADPTDLKRFLTIQKCPRCDLRGADFTGHWFNFANLQGANLQGVNFTRAHLRSANLQNADLRGANFSYANISPALPAIVEKTNFRGANLTGANFFRTEVGGADFTGADMRNTNIEEGYFHSAIFCRTQTPWGIENIGCN